LLVVIKGLPLAYGKDMQEDKEPVFDATDSLSLMLAAMAGMVSDMTVAPEALRQALAAGFPTATDLADWLVRVLDMPFRDAHHVTGTLVSMAEAQGVGLDALPLAAMQEVEPRISKDVFSVLSIDASVASRTSEGGTSSELVRLAAAAARERFL
jgi:argininosuccinate lyase